MWKRLVCLMVAFMICSAMLPVFSEDADDEVVRTEETILKSRESATKIVEVLGTPYLYYAQNSPEWNRLVVDLDPESKHIFGDSACMIVALANCIVNTVNLWDLDRILDKTMNPVRLDSHSVVANRGVRLRDKFVVEKLSDVIRYYPLVIGNYINGNNRTGEYNRKSSAFYRNVLNTYHLTWEKNAVFADALEALDEGKLVIACSGGQRSVMTQEGHYFVLVGRSEGYIYFLDSYLRESFPMDTKGILEIVEPGVVRVLEENASKVPILTRFIVTPNKDKTVMTKAMLDDYIGRSNQHR